MRLTVACVFVRGPYPYTADYVVRLERMVRRYLPRPFRFVCLTDQPWLFRDPIDTLAIPATLDGAVGYWTKLQLFNPAHARFLGERVLFLDLDTLVVGDLSPIVDQSAWFSLVEDELARERPARSVNTAGQTVLRQFNASVMVFDPHWPMVQRIWEAWTPDVAQRLQSDQDWYAELYPAATAMPADWFPRISRAQPPWPEAAKVVLVKKPKNHLAAQQWPWFAEQWGGWAA